MIPFFFFFFLPSEKDLPNMTFHPAGETQLGCFTGKLSQQQLLLGLDV